MLNAQFVGESQKMVATLKFTRAKHEHTLIMELIPLKPNAVLNINSKEGMMKKDSYAQCPICGKISKNGGRFILPIISNLITIRACDNFIIKRCKKHQPKGGCNEYERIC